MFPQSFTATKMGPGLTRITHRNDPGVLLAESLDQQHADGIEILRLIDIDPILGCHDCGK